MLQPAWADNARAIDLLRREAEVGQGVGHPHVISVLAASVAMPPQLIVMPWLKGSTLKTLLQSGTSWEIHRALWIVRQAALGLDGLHRAGWIHGDIKPGNLFISPEGHVTLLDLGFARRDTQPGSAQHRCVMGTITHIAPEMLTKSLHADIRSDIYSLGVVLYEMLCAQLPFQAQDLAELAVQHRQATPPPLAQLAPHVPAEVAALVHQMLAKDPLRRPDSPAELANTLATLELEALAAKYGE